jgi:hypothetical protein
MPRISRGPRNVPSESTTPRGSLLPAAGRLFFGAGPIFSAGAMPRDVDDAPVALSSALTIVARRHQPAQGRPR